MKKYISLFALPLFLIVFSTVISTQIKHAQADVPTPPAQPECPAGSMKLVYGDGSTTATNSVPSSGDPWAPAPDPAPVAPPAAVPAIDWSQYLDNGFIDYYNNYYYFDYKKSETAIAKFLFTKVFAQDWQDYVDNAVVNTGPACASYTGYDTQAAPLACVVMQEQGGGPFCITSDNRIYSGLTNTTCSNYPGTHLAGFKIVATTPTYACGVASPVTDG